MVDVNKTQSLSRAQLIQLLDKNGCTPEEKQIILFNFDTADVGEDGVGTEGAGDKTLRGFELRYFYKLMGWEWKGDNSGQQEQTVQSRSPESVGQKRAVYNPEDKTTLVYDYKEGTITKYDENDNVLGVTDLDGNPIQATAPTPPTTPTQPTTPTKPKQEEVRYTQEEIDQKVRALKPGESFSYVHSFGANLGSIRVAERSTITWVRNQDGTLSRYSIDPNRKRQNPVRMVTVYQDDMQTKVSERKITSAGAEFGIQSNIQYDASGQPTTVTTPLDRIGRNASSFTREGIITRAMASGKFASQEIRDTNGNVILTFSNGEFKNARGKTIPMDKAYDIIGKALNNGNIKELIQTY